MTENSHHPKDDDAVLGHQAVPPMGGAVLGGVQGIKQRLISPSISQRVAALKEALKHGQVGLDLVIYILENESPQLQQEAYRQMRQQTKEKAEQALRESIKLQEQELLERYLTGERNFRKVDLSEAHLSEVDLREANLSEADLSGASLNSSVLAYPTNLSRANLSWADLSDAKLGGADLSNALSKAEWSSLQCSNPVPDRVSPQWISGSSLDSLSGRKSYRENSDSELCIRKSELKPHEFQLIP